MAMAMEMLNISLTSLNNLLKIGVWSVQYYCQWNANGLFLGENNGNGIANGCIAIHCQWTNIENDAWTVYY